MARPDQRRGIARRPWRRTLAVAAALALALGCARASGVDTRPPYEAWALAFSTAQRAAAGGDYVRADTTLLAYAREHPGTPEALDAVFWRGVLALDPANPRGSMTRAAAAFDEYLRSGPMLLRRHEAEVMRRLAIRLDTASRTRELSDVPAGQSDPRDEELRKLREELRRTTEELERIKRRVAPPTTPPPAAP